jgi:hypothetical protein
MSSFRSFSVLGSAEDDKGAKLTLARAFLDRHRDRDGRSMIGPFDDRLSEKVQGALDAERVAHP